MTPYRYRLLNVFALNGQTLSGNPLCVFEDAHGLDDATMQALALQFNLSETTFILPSKRASDRATARVRIFTPTFEMPFAGHPTLGTAHVVRDLYRAGDAVTLAMKAGVIPVNAAGDVWTLTANAPTHRSVAPTRAQLAQMLSLAETDLADSPLWVNTGSEQLLIPLASVEAVMRAAPRLEWLRQYASLNGQHFLVYLWAPNTHADAVTARFFFSSGDAVLEDPATGSACANLGGWHLATGQPLPVSLNVHQGAAVNRPSLLQLNVTTDRLIRVSGLVIELGRGTIEL